MDSDVRADVLLVTATKVETKAVLNAFGMEGRQTDPRSIDGRVYFNLGTVNGTRVMMTQSEMGASGLGASQQAVDKGIVALAPSAVIMVGIAFGINEEKQRIGDVLVTEQLRPYELQRVGTTKRGRIQIVLRDDKPHASPGLLNLFRSAEVTWEGAEVRFGTVLSGAKLVDNLDFREQLRAFEPEAIGGDMEGSGLYVACHARKVDWILVKAICDFADGQKGKEKAERQALAARNAAAYVYHALQFAPVLRSGIPSAEALRESGTRISEIGHVVDHEGLTSSGQRDDEAKINRSMVAPKAAQRDFIGAHAKDDIKSATRKEALVKFTQAQTSAIRKRWLKDPSFLGFPDAERDTKAALWLEHLLVRPEWFNSATQRSTTILVGRKGVGKSAARITAISESSNDRDVIIIQASADELAARHANRLQTAADRGFGAVSDWCQVFAELIVRHVATELGGTLMVTDHEEAIRKWATIEGVSERDFGERVVSVIHSLVPWAKRLSEERGQTIKQDRFAHIAAAKSFALYIDDFDNLQESRQGSRIFTNISLIRDAVEAADRITHLSLNASVHLLMRQDLWLRLRPGWHYADKVAGLVQLNWTQDYLSKWADRRLRLAAATALSIEPDELSAINFDELWGLFFPEYVTLRNDKESSGLHYLVRRTMYTPRGLRQFMSLIVQRARQFPSNLRDIEDAEEEFSTDQLEFLKTEFGGLCEGLGICLQSFTGKPMEIRATDLYKHLKGLIGNGQVRLSPGASDGDDAIALARFLFRIGFLEVRYRQDDRFEVRDAMRHPEHWKSIRKDDAVTWAVRSAFFCVLRSHR